MILRGDRGYVGGYSAAIWAVIIFDQQAVLPAAGFSAARAYFGAGLPPGRRIAPKEAGEARAVLGTGCGAGAEPTDVDAASLF